ncbi:MAG: HAMP domain-containing protein [Desulfobacteraceae bacterium]|nr:HAMP domain-containing protein [Desulfobacteraceae bacterium]
MHLFSSLSIKRKIRFILILISTTGLVIASGAFIFHDLQTIKNDTLQNINTLAYVIEKDLSAALAFNDEATANDTLSALKVNKDIVKACVFDKNRDPFANYCRDGNDSSACDFLETSSAFIWTKKHIDIVKSIRFDGEEYGTLLLHYSLETIVNKFKVEVIITLIILLTSLLFVFFMAVKLEKFITTPILDLKRTANRISDRKDYSIRALKKYPDEVGELVDGFNRMLDEIQHRDAELENQNELLEYRVNERTVLLKKRKEELENAVEKAEKMTEVAEQANKYKSQFLASMSHEIRTPMNAILGFTELLEASIKTEKDKEYLKSISNAGKILLKLINEILDLSKIEAGKLNLEYSSVNIKELFNEIRQFFSKSIKDKGLAFNVQLDHCLPEFLIMDPIRLRQILYNLVGNAVKFTEIGKIELLVEGCNSDDPLKIDLIIKIRDTGIGIDPDEQTAIFDAFRQHKDQNLEEYGGTGLGLTISKRLIKMMKGSISLESELNKGSIFTIILKNVEKGNDKTYEGSENIEKCSAEFNKFNKSTIPDDDLVVNDLVVDDLGINRTLIKNPAPEVKEKLLKLFKIYDEEIVDRLEGIKQTFLISDIEEFAGEIKSIGEEFGFDFLIKWGNDCNKFVDSFDVDNIMNAINTFPDLIGTLKNNCREDV